MVLDHDDANDILQNTFVKAWMGIDGFLGQAKLLTWLYRIATNETITFLNRANAVRQQPQASKPMSGLTATTCKHNCKPPYKHCLPSNAWYST